MKINQTGVPVAYNRDLYEQGVILPLMWNPATHPMMLVVGATGSGKTYSLRIIAGKIVKFLPDVELTICDFKNEDFQDFKGLPRHYGYMECTQGLADFYDAFQRRLDKTDTSTNPRILLFDEWGAYVTSLERKAADQARATLSTIAFLGRSQNTYLIVGLQRGDSSHFMAGSRDQFSAIMAFGNLSKEQKGMLFSEYKDEMIADCSRGTGYFLRDGKGIKRCVVLPLKDMDKLNAIIAKGLMADVSDGNRASCEDSQKKSKETIV